MGVKKLFSWIRPYVGLVVLTVLLTIVVTSSYSYVPQFIKYVIDVVLTQIEGVSLTLPPFLIDYFNSFEDKIVCISVVGISLAIFQLFRGLLMFANGYVKGKIGENMMLKMRTKMYDHIQNLSYAYHNNVDAGDLIQRCTSDIETIKSFLSTQLPEIIYILVSFISGAVQMAMINVNIMLVTLIIVPISVTASIIFFKYVTKEFDEVEKSEASLTTVIQENVNGVRVVKAFNAEKDEINRFDIENEDVKKKNEKLNHGMAKYWGLSDFATMSQYALTVFICILFARNGLVSTGDIIACMMYIGMLVWPIRNLGRIISDFGKSVVASNRIYEILNIEEEYTVNGSLTPEIKGNIEFKNVGFRFPDGEKNLFNGLSFSIKSGETVAIVGRTGSGKSTIANLLVRMLETSSGEILLDGVDIKNIEKHYLRENVGIVLQDPFLYTASIMENIRIASKKLTEHEVYAASKIASIDGDIRQFEKGYQTLVGEKGVTLSGGQKQRIAIARMLILHKPIIIFDDSLSAVDSKTDIKIRKALKENNLSLTSIIITHRITTAREADKIIVIENGKVSAIGKHNELINQEGLYKDLWDIQGSLEDEFIGTVAKGE